MFNFDSVTPSDVPENEKKQFKFSNNQNALNVNSQYTCNRKKVLQKRNVLKIPQSSNLKNNHTSELEEQKSNRKKHIYDYYVEPYNNHEVWQRNIYKNVGEKNNLKNIPFENFNQNIHPPKPSLRENDNHYHDFKPDKNIATPNPGHLNNPRLKTNAESNYPKHLYYDVPPKLLFSEMIEDNYQNVCRNRYISNLSDNNIHYQQKQNVVEQIPNRINRIDRINQNELLNWGGFIEPKSTILGNIQPMVNQISPYFARRLRNPLYQDNPSTYDSHNEINIRHYPQSQFNMFGICRYEQFNPVHFSTQHQYNDKQNILQPSAYPTMQNHYQESCLNNITIGSLGSFQPVHQSTQIDGIYRHRNKTDSIFSSLPDDNKSHTESLINVITIADDFPCKKGETLKNSSADIICEKTLKEEKKSKTTLEKKSSMNTENQTQLFITISNGQKKNLLEHELEMEKDFVAENCKEWASQFSELPEQALTLGNEWEKLVNAFGSTYYVNKKTGFTTYFTPKLDENQFKLRERLDFIPKGMSPILKEVKKVDKSLSQNKKETLLEYLMETYKTELLYVKWQHCFNDMDPKTFFDYIYKVKAKLYDTDIPSIATSTSRPMALNNVISFDKELFSNIEILGQVDRKFIAVLDKRDSLLILFDQHAVHERIRLETLMRSYKNSSYKCSNNLMFFIPQNDLSILQKHESYLTSIGLVVDFFANGITVKEVPMSMYRKIEKEPNDCWSKILQLLINELIDMVKSSRNVLFKTYPKLLQNIINLEACTGAIKFGDLLNKSECIDILRQLNACDLPFQCAHGRPTLTPLIHVEFTNESMYSKIDLKKLHR